MSSLLRGGDVYDIEQLKREGLSVSAISVMTGYDRKTVRRYLRTREAVPIYGPRAPRPAQAAFGQLGCPRGPRLTKRAWWCGAHGTGGAAPV